MGISLELDRCSHLKYAWGNYCLVASKYLFFNPFCSVHYHHSWWYCQLSFTPIYSPYSTILMRLKAFIHTYLFHAVVCSEEINWGQFSETLQVLWMLNWSLLFPFSRRHGDLGSELNGWSWLKKSTLMRHLSCFEYVLTFVVFGSFI